MSEPLKHTKGPFHVEFGDAPAVLTVGNKNAVCTTHGCYATVAEKTANATLLAIADTAPHVCADPACPGDLNRRKLEMFGELVAKLEAMVAAKRRIGFSFAFDDWGGPMQDIDALLARAKELMG
jgi:hypothetical protein